MDARKSFRLHCNEIEKMLCNSDYEGLNEYSLEISFEPDTYLDRLAGCYRWLLSYGGPTEAFEFYHNGEELYKITFTYAWDNYVEFELYLEDFDLLAEVFNIMVPV